MSSRRSTVLPFWLFGFFQLPAAALYLAVLLQPAGSHVTPAGSALDTVTDWSAALFVLVFVGVYTPLGSRLLLAQAATVLGFVPALATLSTAYLVPRAAGVAFIWLAVGVVVVSGCCLYLLGVSEPETGAGFRRSVLTVVGVAVVPLFGFWQQAVYEPSQNVASLTVTPAAELQTDPAGGRHWVVTVRAENSSPVPASVIIATVVVCQSASEDPGVDDIPVCRPLPDPIRPATAISAGGALIHVDSIAAVPALPFVRVQVRYAVAREDRFRERPGTRQNLQPNRPDCRVVQTFALQDDSRYNALIGGGFDFVSFWTDQERNFGISQDPVTDCPVRNNQFPARFRDRSLEDHYGVTEVEMYWVGWASAEDAPAPPP